MDHLISYGFQDFFVNQLELEDGNQHSVGRIVSGAKGNYLVGTNVGLVRAYVGQKVFDDLEPGEAPPGIGDFVLLHAASLIPGQTYRCVRLLRRKSVLVRKRPGVDEPQLLAANVDTVWIVTSANREFNLARLERYLSLAYDGRCEPVVVINKCDPGVDFKDLESKLMKRFPWVTSHYVSALHDKGLAELAGYLKPGCTVALVGSSGVGKTTLRNQLVVEAKGDTGGIRESDDKGRHTTTSRDIVFTKYGGLLADTPGLRELSLWQDDGGIDQLFSDIATIALQCKFSNCRHEDEPGCAVREAIASGTLLEDRLRNFAKLQREQAFLERKLDPAKAANSKKRWKAVQKSVRQRRKLEEK